MGVGDVRLAEGAAMSLLTRAERALGERTVFWLLLALWLAVVGAGLILFR
jgi:hypothetical protein